MSIQKKTTGVALAVALATAAALFIAGAAVSVAPTAAKAADGVKCMGVNSCKGHGWVSTKSAKECMDKGGSVVKG